MIKNIFITGKPGCGKTTLIREILKELKIPARGFFTQEIRREGERIGFEIITLTGKKGILAEKGIKSSYKVSKYNVVLRDLEEIGVKEIKEGLKENSLIIIDEVGKMELFSQKFKKVLSIVLESENKILGTIMLAPYRTRSDAGLKPNSFCDRIKQRPDTKIFYLTKENFQEIKEKIKNLLK
ncbi:hypothetical protein AMJ49_00575 [Parcubacteria bacterium DG_74_2]|nr:MAG: hypothetical protein AMJ49_00575 [Parcubacteria bacterium DG_74_2]